MNNKPKDIYDPLCNTTTTDYLTNATKDSANGPWEEWWFSPGEKTPQFFRVNLESVWLPLRKTQERRWAGLNKPKTKSEALRLYNLDSAFYDIKKDWYLFVFDLRTNVKILIFRSKVKGGVGNQIKIPNSTCEYIRIISKERVED